MYLSLEFLVILPKNVYNIDETRVMLSREHRLVVWSNVLGAVLDGAGAVDSEVLQAVRNDYYKELRERVALDVGADLLMLVFAR